MTINKDTIIVSLRDCEVSLFVGIYDHERPKPQPIIIHVEAKAPLVQRYDNLKNSHIESVIDYERLYDFITTVLPDFGHIPLIESVAERIIRFCFEDPRIEEVRVRIDKPDAFKGKTIASIEMHRQRSTP